MKKQRKNRMDKMLEIPKEVYSNIPKLSVTGFEEMVIENYKGILEYEEFFVRISTHIGIININGYNLNLETMTNDDIKVTGKIKYRNRKISRIKECKMLIKVILSYILGYVKIAVEGYYLERFINICNSKKITIWNLKKDKNVKLYLNVRIQDFKTITKIAKKTGCKVKISKKCGLPFFMNRYKKRKIFAFFLGIIIVLTIVSSNFIWNVEIREEDGKNIENLEQDLEENGLKVGELKSKVDTKGIINKIRLKRADIAWMGIELKGTNAIVKVIKADEKPEIINEEDYCNIVSNKVGVITKINAQNGTANVKVGDTVNVGTTLINRVDGRKIHRN